MRPLRPPTDFAAGRPPRRGDRGAAPAPTATRRCNSFPSTEANAAMGERQSPRRSATRRVRRQCSRRRRRRGGRSETRSVPPHPPRRHCRPRRAGPAPGACARSGSGRMMAGSKMPPRLTPASARMIASYALAELAEARVDIAADGLDLEVGPGGEQLTPPTQAAGADARRRSGRSATDATACDARTSRVFPRGNGRDDQVRRVNERHRDRHVLEAMDGEVDRPAAGPARVP